MTEKEQATLDRMENILMRMERESQAQSKPQCDGPCDATIDHLKAGEDEFAKKVADDVIGRVGRYFIRVFPEMLGVKYEDRSIIAQVIRWVIARMGNEKTIVHGFLTQFGGAVLVIFSGVTGAIIMRMIMAAHK